MATPSATQVSPDAHRWNARLSNVLFFAWWRSATTRFQAWSPTRRWTIIGLCMVIGIGARLWAQTLPGNYDFDSWSISADRVLAGQDPYATSRYNYAPPWLTVLTGLRIVGNSPEGFRLGITIVLTLVDIGIALLLIRRRYALPACLFLISPITIAISGQHQQFDNIAVFFTLAAMCCLVGDSYRKIDRQDVFLVLLLGLSISFKHIFLVFPLWLAMRAGSWPRRMLYLFAPLVIFALILAPAYFSSPHFVTKYVISYKGANNSPFLYALLPDQLVGGLFQHGLGRPLCVLALIAAGLLFRRLAGFEMALAYTITVVLLSWAVVNQYLAIPMAAIAVFLNLGFAWWLLLAIIYLAGDPAVLGIWGLRSIQPHLLLEYNVVAQDLFLPLLSGWALLLAWIHRKAIIRVITS